MQRTSRLLIVDRWHEIPVPSVLSSLLVAGSRAFQREVHDGHLSVIVAKEPKGWHLSVSHRTNEMRPRPGRYPTWDEIADVRYHFIPNEVTVAMFLPPKEEYVNLHDTTFHLHQVQGEFE